jgi:Pentapeptide repeats (8 copies)
VKRKQTCAVHRLFIAVRYTAIHVPVSEGGRGLAANSEHGKLWKLLHGLFKRRALQIVGVVVLGAVVITALFMLLNLYIAPTKPSGRKDLVLALAQILGGAALLSGLYVTWRTLQVNREGQITERFTRAIDQLGSEELEIRLGGIYALERIARESEDDYWPIMEILTAYVRQRAPKRPAERGVEEDKPTGVPDFRPDRPDIQAIMTVLRRRKHSYGRGEPESLELFHTNLTLINLWGANLVEAILVGADFTRSFLREVNFSAAGLNTANLTRTYLWRANFRGADLTGANLSGANLIPAQLEETTGDENTQLPSGLKPPEHWG